MNDLTRPERLQIMLTAAELKAVDDWRFTQRMPSRAAAVRELLRTGMTAVGALVAEDGSKSTDYGVINRTSERNGGRENGSGETGEAGEA